MMEFRPAGLKLVGVAFGALLLTGCVGQQLGEARKVSSGGASDFAQALYSNYMKLSKAEFDEGDYEDSDVFAARAMAAAGNKPTAVEEMSARKIPGAYVGELASARREVMEMLAAGAAEQEPVDMAGAQAQFECWMQEQEENFQPKDIEDCKKAFMILMKALRISMAPKPAPKPAPAPAPAPTSASFTIYFDFNSAKISAEQMKTLYKAVLAVDGMRATKVSVSGHTDRAGADAYNVKLSDMRAKAVAKALDENTSTDLSNVTKINVLGEQDPAIATADGVKELKNRRVTITVAK
jgi:OmpA-OmpF porin, OOP family